MLVGALITLAIVCTLLLLAKSRNSINKNEAKRADDIIAGKLDASKRCFYCNESNLSCRTVYNRLFGPKGGSPADSCTKCGGPIGHRKQFNSYGNVAVGGWSEPNDSSLGGSCVGEPSERSLASKPIGATLDLGRISTVEEQVSRKSGEAERGCTGLSFDPDSVGAATPSSDSSSASSSSSEEAFAAETRPLERGLAPNNSLASSGSFQTILTMQSNDDNKGGDEFVNGCAENGSATKLTGNGAAKFKWMRTVRKVWRAQHIVELLRQAGKQVSSLKLAASSNLPTVVGKYSGSFQCGSGQCDGSPGGQQRVIRDFEEDEPKLLSSRKLRSADIVM